MKVCLIVPPRPYLIDQKAIPHLGLLTVASVLKDRGYEVEFLDFADGWEYVDAEIYGITATTPDFTTAIKIKDWIKEHNRDAIVAIGGPMATLMSMECIKHFDVVCSGDFASVAHFDWLCKFPVIIGGMSTREHFDKYHPDRDLVDLWDYEFYVCGERATTTVFTHSCVWRKCAFCCRYQMPYDKLRLHSVKWCEEEIAEIADKGFRAIQVYDDEFLCFPKRDEQIVRLFPEYGIKVWRCFMRADYCLRNRDLVKLAVRNGLGEVLMGIESVDAKVLELIDKGTTADMYLKAIEFLHSLNVRTKLAFIVGLPGETEESLTKMWKFCERVEPMVADYDFTILTPYPGSKLWKNPERYGIEFDKKEIIYGNGWYKGIPGKYDCKIRHSNLSKEQLLKWRDLLEQRFKLKHVRAADPGGGYMHQMCK